MPEPGHGSCAGAGACTTTTSGQQSGQCPSPAVDARAVLGKLPENQRGNSQFITIHRNSYLGVQVAADGTSEHSGKKG